MIQFSLFQKIRNKHSKLIVAVLLAFIFLWAMRALFHSGFYTSHDGWHQVARAYHFHKAIDDGQFPPRWSGDLFYGFGYPLFIFSYHMPWLITEPLLALNVSIFDAIKIVFIITYVISGIIVYLWVTEMWGMTPGIVSGILFSFTPYRFLNIFVRANIGEAVSFVFFPLLFWGIYKLYKKSYFMGIIFGSIGIAGLILSHIMALILLLITICLFTFVTFLFSREKRNFLTSLVMMVSLGAGLTSYYLLPAIFYKSITVFSDIYQRLYERHFTPLAKLLYSPWDYAAIDSPGEMSRQIGLVLWLCIFLIVPILLYRLKKMQKKNDNYEHFIGGIFFIGFIIAVFLMLKVSLPVWKLIEKQVLLDFPWRFLLVTTFTGSLCAGYIIRQISNKNIKSIVMIILIIGVFYTNRNHLRVNQYTDIPLSLYISSEKTTNSDDEYIPKWVERGLAGRETPLVTLMSAQGEATNIQKNSHMISFDLTLNQESEVNVHHMNFPGWTLFIDGTKVKIGNSDFGGMQFNTTAGSHDIVIRYIPTLIMRIGELITLISLLTVGVIGIKYRNSRNQK